MKAQSVLALVSTGIVFLAGCQHPGPRFNPRAAPAATALQPLTLTNRVQPEWLKPPTNLFTLGPGDKLEIELLEERIAPSSTGNPGNNNPGENNTNLPGNQPKDGNAHP